MPHRWTLIAAALAVLFGSVALRAGRGQDAADDFIDALDAPAIGYNSIAPSDPVSQLARQLQAGTVTLAYDNATGYLPALLETLDIPIASQLAVYSKTSLQQRLISPQNPRVIYFNDTVMVAWPRGGFIEIASQDPRQGVVFYMLPQQPGRTGLLRRNECLSCHHSYNTLGVPGLLVRSVVTASHGESMPFLGNYLTDDRSPFAERWAGWYVTGASGPTRHLGNQLPPPTRDTTTRIAATRTSATEFPEALDGYLSHSSDIAAHLVFDHQTRVINLLTRLGWLVRLAEAAGRDPVPVATRGARELVDALLFVDAIALPGPVTGDAAFVKGFTSRGPTDSKGRSLRLLDLRTRLLRYPCSYMIYAPAFDALPPAALEATYRRLWAVLSGAETDARYGRLLPADRSAIVDILRETKRGLPEYFAAGPLRASRPTS